MGGGGGETDRQTYLYIDKEREGGREKEGGHRRQVKKGC